MVGTIHLEKRIKAPVARVYSAFGQTKSLRGWYDPLCDLDKATPGGKLIGDNYPSAEILAVISNHIIVHRYRDLVSGLGIWSFVEKSGGKSTLLVFDQLDAYDRRDERDSITFYWTGPIENLAAFCEGRELPFDHDAGDYKEGLKRRV